MAEPAPPTDAVAKSGETPGFRRRVVNNAAARVADIVKDDVESTVDALKQSQKTWSWTYPMKGIVYFATHPSLWAPFLRNLPALLGLSATVLFFTFSVVWVPTMAVAIFLTGPLAIISATISTLTLSASIIQTIALTYILPVPLVDIFDATLVLKGHADLVNKGREVRAPKHGDAQNVLGRLGTVWKKPLARFSVDKLFRRLVYVPINMIPIAGPGIALVMQARSGGGECHDRYFQLKGWSTGYTNAFVSANNGSFALVNNLLNIIPFAAIAFQYTTAVGAALWAADIEAKKVRMIQPELRVN